MRKVSLAERRKVVETYRNTLMSIGEMAQLYCVSKRNVCDILRAGGITQKVGRPMKLFSRAEVRDLDARGMVHYRCAAASHRVEAMMTELKTAQSLYNGLLAAGYVPANKAATALRRRLTTGWPDHPRSANAGAVA